MKQKLKINDLKKILLILILTVTISSVSARDCGCDTRADGNDPSGYSCYITDVGRCASEDDTMCQVFFDFEGDPTCGCWCTEVDYERGDSFDPGRPFYYQHIQDNVANVRYEYSEDLRRIENIVKRDANSFFLPSYYFFDGLGRLAQVQKQIPGKVIISNTEYLTDSLKSRDGKPYEEAGTAGEYRTPVWDVYTTYAYDGLGRVLTTTLMPDGIISSVEYGDDWVKAVDPLMQYIITYNDAFGRTVSVNENNPDDPDMDDLTTTASYDVMNNVISITDASSRSATNSYNMAGWLLQSNHPDTGTTTFVYDNGGRMTSKTDANNIITYFKYDTLDRARFVTTNR